MDLFAITNPVLSKIVVLFTRFKPFSHSERSPHHIAFLDLEKPFGRVPNKFIW